MEEIVKLSVWVRAPRFSLCEGALGCDSVALSGLTKVDVSS